MRTSTVATLNGECYCRTLDSKALQRNLLEQAGSGELMAALLAQQPTLFAATAVFLSQATPTARVACSSPMIFISVPKVHA